ncbi:undecaprenyl-diphosphate phosphatase, partial [Burkholderia cenocepacia]|uniref:undecaprenyl-diphosphate phosphatase n=6 Tax=Burkholderia cenocepacia TaxID=95486 RepID=UPI0024AFE958
MDWILICKALILGVVEGLTEFLPVSSTGHLIVAGSFLNFNDSHAKTFDVVIQFGAILAVCWEYRQRIVSVVSGLPSRPDAQRFTLNVVIATIPAIALGLLISSICFKLQSWCAVWRAALPVGGYGTACVSCEPLSSNHSS